ncbi:MAG: guanylate kinase [Prevotella sp.]
MKTVILCIIGASGSGKTTIEGKLVRYRPGTYNRIVSHTTRPMREDEVQGREHIFTTPDERPPREQMLAYTRYGEYEYWADEADIVPDCVNTYVIDVDGYHYLKEHFGDRYDIRVMYVRRRNNTVDSERRNRDRGRLTLNAEDVDVLYNNNGTLVSLELDMPRIDRELTEQI